MKAFSRRTMLGGLVTVVNSATGHAVLGRDLQGASTPDRAAPTLPGLPAAQPLSVGVASDLTEKIDSLMAREIAAGRQSGAVTAIARRGRLIHFAAHGAFDIERGTSMTADSLFRMMSSTKPVTGVALLQQMEAGRVSLDDRASRFIPELKDLRVRAAPGSKETVQADREITVRDLATHTSGLNGFLVNIPPGTPNTLAARAPYAKDLVLEFQPGSQWSYSAVTGPDVLARIIEISSGLSYDQYLKERIFEPVGMRDTAYNLTDDQRARLVPRYTRDGDKWRREAGDTPLAETLLARSPGPNPATTYYSGSFGLNSTARDYLLFETMLLNGGEIEGRRLLRPESVALMRTNLVGSLYKGHGAYPKPVEGTGFGVLVKTVLDPATCGCGRGVGASGWLGAYGTTSWSDPHRELAAVFLVQQRVDAIEFEFETLISAALVA